MNQTMSREEAEFYRDKRKWTVRRRFAINSFAQLLLLTLFYIIAPFYMSPEAAKVFAEFNSIIITLIGFHTSIIMLYMGAVTYADQVNQGVLTKNITAERQGQ